MTVFDELKARGLLAQLTDEEEIKELINNGKATFYIGFDCTADSLTAGHFMALVLMKRLQIAGNKPIALDGGGSNLRMIVVDKETEEELYFKEINTGTNLSTVPNREQALNNIKRLIANGYSHMPSEYTLVGIGLSSAGTEIKGTKEDLEKALREVVETLKTIPTRPLTITPKLYVTNDIDVLLHSADIALARS